MVHAPRVYNREQNLLVVKLEESAAESHCAQQSVPINTIDNYEVISKPVQLES